jgi:RND family efflux transporter MFP subunit
MSNAQTPQLPRRDEHPRTVRLLFIAGIVFLIVLAVGVLTSRVRAARKGQAEQKARSARQAEGPKLAVIKVESSRTERSIQLPGEVRGYRQTTLYPKISGYVADVRFERGDRVKAGQILAIIESPETDQGVLSAQSDAVTKRLNAARANTLSPTGVISQMDRDNATAAAKIADAELRRARALRRYEVVTAPFDGVASARYVDPGALLPAATGSTQSAVPVADVADVDRVRVLVYLGQDTALFAAAGDPVRLWERERPEKRIDASVTRCGKALDARTRTMTCEIEIDNREAGLMPGSFVDVELHQNLPPRPTIPNEAVLVRSGETVVALVDRDRVHLQPVVLGDNDGRTVRVERGLSGGETIGLSVPMEVEEATKVQPSLQAARPTSSVGGGPPASAAPNGSTRPPAKRAP